MLPANLAGQVTRRVFERAGAEIARTVAVEQIFADKILEAAAPLALGYVGQLMKEKFTVSPAIGPDDNAVTERDCPGSIGYDLGAPSCFGEFLVLGQKNPVHNEHSHAGGLLYAGPPGIGHLVGIERNTVFEDISFLPSGPRAGKRRETVEIFLFDHMGGVVKRF